MLVLKYFLKGSDIGSKLFAFLLFLVSVCFTGCGRLCPARMDVYFKKGRAEISWLRTIGGVVDYEMRAAIGRNISLVESRLEVEAIGSETGKWLAFVVTRSLG